MTIFHYNRYYILNSLICYLLEIKCTISVPISAAHFTYAFLGGRWGWGICTHLTQDDFSGAGENTTAFAG